MIPKAFSLETKPPFPLPMHLPAGTMFGDGTQIFRVQVAELRQGAKDYWGIAEIVASKDRDDIGRLQGFVNLRPVQIDWSSYERALVGLLREPKAAQQQAPVDWDEGEAVFEAVLGELR